MSMPEKETEIFELIKGYVEPIPITSIAFCLEGVVIELDKLCLGFLGKRHYEGALGKLHGVPYKNAKDDLAHQCAGRIIKALEKVVTEAKAKREQEKPKNRHTWW